MDVSEPDVSAEPSVCSDMNIDSKQDEVDGSPTSDVTDGVLQSTTEEADSSQPPLPIPAAPLLNQDQGQEENDVSSTTKPNESILISEPRSISECDDGETNLVIDFGEVNQLANDGENVEKTESDKKKHGINDTDKMSEEKIDANENEQNKDNDPESKSAPVIQVVSNDIGLDYFERLENSLRELEKQMSSSGNSETPEQLSDSGSTVSGSAVLQNGFERTKDTSTVETGNKSEDSKEESDPKEKEKDPVVAPSGVQSGNIVDSETLKGSIDNMEKSTSNKPEVKLSTANANAMWSKIGMMRCTNCSFTTDQESMLNSHTVICSKRKVVKGEINFKYKADRYGCEACLYTTKSVRNFEEHVAFHLLAQPYICLKCVATFESKAAIENHVSTIHCDESVKCGLRGSKKISHIIGMLHKDSKFSITGRMLDKKIWNMSMASTAKEQNTHGNSGQVQNTSILKKIERPAIIQPKNFMKTSSSKKESFPLEPSEKTEKTASEKATTTAKPVPVQSSPPVVPKACTTTSSIQLPGGQTSAGGLNVSSFILVPVTMAPKPPPPVVQPNKPPGLVSILGTYNPSLNRPQQQMIVMNQSNVRPTTSPRQFIVLPPTTSTATSPIVRPPNILIDNQNLHSTMIQTHTTLQPKLILTSQQQAVVSSTVSPKLHSSTPNSASNNQCISIQYNEGGKANTTTQKEDPKELSTDEKLGTVIDLTEGSSQNNCRISFRKVGSSYTCKYCKVKTETEDGFSRHIWRHFHGMPQICKTCSNDYTADDVAKCALVAEVMKKLVACDVEENNKLNKVIEVVSDDDDPVEGQRLASNTEAQIERLDTQENSTNIEEDSGMQIKIASTYSLSESSKLQADIQLEKESEPPVLSEEVKEDRNSPRKKDSGNIFEKLQGSINVDQTYNNRDNSKGNSPSPDQRSEDASHDISNKNSRNSPSITTSSIRSTEAPCVKEMTAMDANKGTSLPEKVNKTIGIEEKTPKFSCNGSFYVCGFTDCRFACITSGEYREHLMCWHSDAEEYKCAHCGHRSLSEDCHLRHMLTHSKASSFILYTCSYPACLYGTNVVDLFRDHWKKFHPNTKQFKCRSCKMLFSSAEDLITHIQANILKFVTCPHCTAKDSNRKTIIAHIIEAHPGKPRQITVASQLVCQERDNNEFAVPVPGIPDKPTEVSPWPSVYMDDANDDDDNDVCADSPDQNNSCDDTEVDDEQPDHLDQQSELSKAKGSLTKIAAEGDMRDAVKVMALNKSKLKSLSAEIIRCSECSYLASGRGLLRKHLFLHKRGKDERKRRFSCPCCPAAMDKLSKLSCHMNLHEGQHKVKVFFCTLCAFKTNVTEFLSTHMSKSHNCEITKGINFITKVLKVSVSAFFCNKCLFGTRDQEVFRQHELGHNDDEENGMTAAQESSYHASSTSTPVTKPHTKKPPMIRNTFNENLNEEDLASVNPGSRKRFCCKLCGKYCSRLPALKAHMASHVLDADLEVMVYKCHYCAYSSTYKAFVSRHCEEKHPGKIIRVKRRVDVISAAGEYFPPHGQEWPESPEDMDDPEEIEISDMSICSHHCDMCPYSCDEAAELLRHKNSQHPYPGTKKTFIVPSGNVFRSPVECTECSFTTTRRIELLKHIKIHPVLSPSYETQPKEQRELLKVAIGKKTVAPHSYEPYSNSPSPDPDSEHTPSPQMEDKKPKLAEDGSLIQDEVQKPKVKTPLYFLGGDLLHLKLRPCFIQEESNSEFTCKLCQDTFSGRYVLHKHILQHMDVSFYKCAYCSHGTLESPSMVVHIQKIHRKPIQHVQMDVTDLESKINKAIHSIKEEEYFVRMQDSDSSHANTDGREVDSGDDFQPSETNFRSPFKTKVPPLTIKTSPSYDIVKKKSASTAKKSTTSKPKPSIVNKPLQKSPVYKPPVEDNPNIQRMGDIYKCKVCSYTSTSRATVFNHLTIHSGFRRFGCPFCPYRSHWRHDCLKHIRTHHPGKQGQPTADDPPEDFDNQLTLKPDKNSSQSVPKLPKPPPQPKQPSATLESQPPVEGAETENTPEYRHVFKCLVCDTKFKSIWSIQKHFSKECSQPMLGCSTCKFKDLEPGTVKLHIETKHPGSETSRIVTLKRDAKMRKYTIPTFKKQDSKESVDSAGGKSVKSEGTDQEPAIPPPLNPTSTATIAVAATDADAAAANATTVTATSSTTVAATESQYSKLKSPISTSTNLSILIKRIGNRYMCKECGFSNPIKRALLRHVKKHSNARPFGCTYCEYRSNNECNTKRHMRRRHIGKPVIVKRLEPSQWYSPISSDLKYSRKPFSAPTTPVLELPNSDDIEDDLSEGDGNANSETSSNVKARVEIRYFWKCLECGNKSNSVSNAYRHLKKGTCTKTLYGCSGCKLKNTDRKAVEFHLTEKHLNKNVQITICPNTAKIRKYHIPIKVGGYIAKAEDDISQYDDTSNSAASIASNTKTLSKENEDAPKQNGEKSQVVFCSACNLKASNARIFQSHMESEHTGMLMVCKHCTIFRTAFVSKIQQHTWDSHPEMPLKFYLRTKKGIPDEEKRPSERYTCAKCDYIGKRSSVRQHLYCHFEYKPYKCGHCGYQTKKNDGVRRHIEKQHIGKPMKILFKRNAAQEQEIEMLLDSNSPVKLSYQKSHAARLAKESLSTPPIKANPTQVIKKNFPTLANMKNSAVEDFIPSKMYKPFFNNKAGRPGFTCLLCPYNTFMQNTMISHVYHHMNSIYRCPYCPNHGYPRSRVTTHIRKQHPGKPVYVIDERQNKGGSTNSTASSTVTSEYSSEPTEKRRRIDNSSDIEVEEESNAGSTTGSIKEETGVIQYSCHICSYSSQSLYHYRQHLAAHGGFKWVTAGTQLESRLKCGYCSYLAAGDKDFNTHMEKHLATRPYSCPYCDFSQYTQGKVKTHVTYAHPDKPVEVSRESGSSCLIDDTLQLDSVTLVQLDPTVKLVDILSLGASEYEKLLLGANISIVDFDSLSDDRFSAVASNLGISLENHYEVKKETEEYVYGNQYGDYVVKTENVDGDIQTPTVATGGEMDITSMVAAADNPNILGKTNQNMVDTQGNMPKDTDENCQLGNIESNRIDNANDFSDVSDAPLSQDDESEEVETADESLVEMDFESVSQESVDTKSLPESSVNENTIHESVIDTEEEATLQYASAMEEDDESDEQIKSSVENTNEAMDALANEEEEPSDLDTSGISNSEPMWASQGFEVIDEV